MRLLRGSLRGYLLGVLLLMGTATFVGCARPVAPTGGPVPETPLRVVASSPEPLAIVSPFEGAVRVLFERTMSERMASGSLQEAVVVSPMTGEARIVRGGDNIEVSLEGGFLPGLVYRITVLPRFQDRYQNRMAGPYDLIFSTGPELAPNLLAGVVTSRLTLDPVPGIRVDALLEGGEFPHAAIVDSAGVFTFPHLPEGRYDLVAYEDLNRNQQPDFSERQDRLAIALNRGDTLVVTDLALLAPDTTAAVLEGVARQDSLSLRLTFDDDLDPEASLEGVEARVLREGANAPEVVEVLHAHVWRSRTATTDDDADGPPTTLLLPVKEMVLVLSRPLLPGVTYQLEVEGVTNLQGVPGGGGEMEVEGPPEVVSPPGELAPPGGAIPDLQQNPIVEDGDGEDIDNDGGDDSPPAP